MSKVVTPYHKRDTVRVDLKAIEDTKIAIYETDTVCISVSYTLFNICLQNFHQKYSHILEDAILQKNLTKLFSKKDAINIQQSINDKKLQRRYFYRLAELLERGEANIVNKKTGEITKLILIVHFEDYYGPLAAIGGRLFYLPDGTLFYNVIDWQA